MPDADGRVPPVAYSIPPEKWEQIFGSSTETDEDE